MPRVIAVTGGTGFVGRALVQQLTQQGFEVRSLVRKPSPNPSIRGVTPVEGTLDQPESLARLMAGADAVIHLVGIIREFRELTFERVHAAGTEAVVQAARKARVVRYIQMSALGTRPNAVSRYHQTKWIAEETVRRSDLEWTILRPSMVYGKEDSFVNLFDRMGALSPVIPVMGGGKKLMQPLPVEDTVKAFAMAVSDRETVGKTFALCGSERLSFRQILEQVMRAKRRHRLFLPIPMPLARVQASILETVFPALLGQPAPLNRDQLLMLMEDNVGDPRPAQEQFGLELPSFTEGLKRMFSKDP